MSNKVKNHLRYERQANATADYAVNDISENDLKKIYHDTLKEGIHGFCFSAYEEGQKPGHILTKPQIIKRLKIIKQHSEWVRTFSCTDGNQLIPEIAKELGLKTLVGAWIGTDHEKNELEINNLIELAKKGWVDIAAVGNEVLYREDLQEAELRDMILSVKQQIPDIPVSYVDAYYEFVQKPDLAGLCDVILCNCYPYWEGTSIDGALQHMASMHALAQQAAPGKKVIITETGWPSEGESLMDAEPSAVNAMRYFVNTQKWARNEGIEVYYFASFDEPWKVNAEGTVGAYWGIWDKNEKLKFT